MARRRFWDSLFFLELRKVILRCLLLSLALAAAAGVLAVLLPIEDVLVRVMLTGLATAVAAGLFMLLSLMIDRRRTRAAGLFGMATVTAEFVLALASLWLERWMSGRTEEEVGLTMLLLGLVGIAVLVYLLLVRSRRGSIAGLVGVVTAAAAFAAFMVATWLPGDVWRYDEWWGTGWTVGGFGIVVAACVAGAGTGDRRHWRWLGVLGAAGSAALLMVEVWWGGVSEELFSVVTSVALVVGYANLIVLVPLKPAQRWLQWAVCLSGVATAVFVDLAVFTDGSRTVEPLALRLTAAAGIVTGCGTMALLVLAALNRRIEVDRRTSEIRDVTVVCPCCGRGQAVPLGTSTCPSCGLRMHVRIEEPRCPNCDYLLYRLTSGRCPECGTRVAKEADQEEALPAVE